MWPFQTRTERLRTAVADVETALSRDVIDFETAFAALVDGADEAPSPIAAVVAGAPVVRPLAS